MASNYNGKKDNKIQGSQNQTNPANQTQHYTGNLTPTTGSGQNMPAYERPPMTVDQTTGQMTPANQTTNPITGLQTSQISGQQNTQSSGQNWTQPSSGLSGVSAGTQAQLNQYGQGYKPSENVTAAEAQLNAILGQKPEEYTSRYDDQISQLISNLTSGQQKFDYNFNDDELFKYYSDLYQNQGRQAAADVMGQAAALTGGYGNSYAQSAGNQAYQQYLTNLYDKGMEMRDRAYQQYQDDLTNRYNQLGVLQNAENTDYGRFRDTLTDWMNERGYYTDRADTLSAQDWQRWANDRDFWTQMAQAENSDYWTGMNYNQQAQQFAEQMGLNWAQLSQEDQHFLAQLMQNQSQFDANMAYNYENMNQSNAANWVQAILANGQMPSAELLAAAGLSKPDAQAILAQAAATGGGGGSAGSSTHHDDTEGDQQETYGPSAMDVVQQYAQQMAANTVGSWWEDWLNQQQNGKPYVSPAVGGKG